MNEFFVSILSGEIKWTAINQSMLNGLLILVAIWFCRRELRALYKRLDDAVDLAQEGLRQMRELKMSDMAQNKDIEHLKSDVDSLYGRPRQKRKP